MELKLARTELKSKPKASISIDKIEQDLEKEGEKIYYFDRDNTHKQLISLVENFEKKGFSVYHRIVKYGLDENDYCYEVHILWSYLFARLAVRWMSKTQSISSHS